MARTERNDAQRQAGTLLSEITEVRKKRTEAEEMTAGLAAEVSQGRVRIRDLETEVERQSKEGNQLKMDINNLQDRLSAVEKEFAEAKASFEEKDIEHSSLFGVVDMVCDDLQVAQLEGSTMLVARAALIPE